jgi:hypothetical protein
MTLGNCVTTHNYAGTLFGRFLQWPRKRKKYESSTPIHKGDALGQSHQVWSQVQLIGVESYLWGAIVGGKPEASRRWPKAVKSSLGRGLRASFMGPLASPLLGWRLHWATVWVGEGPEGPSPDVTLWQRSCTGLYFAGRWSIGQMLWWRSWGRSHLGDHYRKAVMSLTSFVSKARTGAYFSPLGFSLYNYLCYVLACAFTCRSLMKP